MYQVCFSKPYHVFANHLKMKGKLLEKVAEICI